MEKVAIVGAGLMGSTIALNFALYGQRVLLLDVDQKAIDRSKRLIDSSLFTLVEEGVIEAGLESEVRERICFCLDMDEVVQSTFVLEAVPEVPSIKGSVFKQLDQKLSLDQIVFASNTSGLNVFELVPERRRPFSIITHFFAPAHIIPLVEVVRDERTSRETLERTLRLLEGIGKVPVLLKEYKPGFLVNRIQRAIGETVLEMIEEGYATPEEIDRAVKLTLGIRLPILGVVQTFDFQGLDMLFDAMRAYGRVFKFVEEKVQKGYLGVKTSRGIYDYQGRTEEEVVRERDRRLIRTLRFLEGLKAFEPL